MQTSDDSVARCVALRRRCTGLWRDDNRLRTFTVLFLGLVLATLSLRAAAVCADLLQERTLKIRVTQLGGMFLDSAGYGPTGLIAKNDSWMQYLPSDLRRVTYVDFNSVPLRRADLELPNRFKCLLGLVLRGTPIRDEDLDALHCREQLHFLDLSYTGITDDGLAKLHVCRQLRGVWLDGTDVTCSGITELRRQFPNLVISHECDSLGGEAPERTRAHP